MNAATGLDLRLLVRCGVPWLILLCSCVLVASVRAQDGIEDSVPAGREGANDAATADALPLSSPRPEAVTPASVIPRSALSGDGAGSLRLPRQPPVERSLAMDRVAWLGETFSSLRNAGRAFWLTWIGVNLSLTLANAAAGAILTDEGDKQSFYINAAGSLLGVAELLLVQERTVFLVDPQSEQDIPSACEALREAAERQAEYFEPLAYIGPAVYAAAVGSYLAVRFEDWFLTAQTVGGVIFVSALKFLTSPTGARTAWRASRSRGVCRDADQRERLTGRRGGLAPRQGETRLTATVTVGGVGIVGTW